jgi:uncharacterized protein (DUF1697 family)
MDRLRERFEELGFTEVSTFIASGNVWFTAGRGKAPLERRIEEHLHAALGYAVPCFIRTPEELRAVVAHQPFHPADLDGPGHTLHVLFLRNEPDEAGRAALLGLRTAYDEFALRGREAYWLCRGKFSGSQVKWTAAVRRAVPAFTARNITMLRKLAAKG